MIFSILLLVVIVFLSWKISPREKAEDAHVHGAGQIGLLALSPLGVDYLPLFLWHWELMHAYTHMAGAPAFMPPHLSPCPDHALYMYPGICQ
jgi:hypothetical protein